MSSNDIQDLKDLIASGVEIIFKDDFKEGNILYVEGNIACYMDYTDEIEREIDLELFSKDHFVLDL